MIPGTRDTWGERLKGEAVGERAEREKERKDVIDQEDVLQVFAISVGENYRASRA